MLRCFFATDLHGKIDRYEKLFYAIRQDRPFAVFLGGDLLPFSQARAALTGVDFINNYLKIKLTELKREFDKYFPTIFLILGNDDPAIMESEISQLADLKLIEYIHRKKVRFFDWDIYGYCFIPPTPFMLKDWERYDVSRFVDPGCFPPDKGKHTIGFSDYDLKYTTIKKDLEDLAVNNPMQNAIFLFHSPPYKTKLDRAALDGRFIDGVPVDYHIGSIAIEKFIRTRQPYLTMHGHVHESTCLTGSWRDKIGRTIMFNAAHHGDELSLIKFDLENPDEAVRELL